jgi:hypothetical protein
LFFLKSWSTGSSYPYTYKQQTYQNTISHNIPLPSNSTMI